MKTDWNWKTAIEQIESCNYVCEAGPLEKNVAYIWIKATVAEKDKEIERLKKELSKIKDTWD